MSEQYEQTDLGLMAEVSRVTMMCRTAITQALEPLGFTESRWRAMIHINNLGEGCTQLQLAESLQIEMPSLTRTVKQLEQSNWIERRVGSEDKRARHLYFTDTGREQVVELKKRISEIKPDIYAGLKPSDLQSLANIISILERNARRFFEEE